MRRLFCMILAAFALPSCGEFAGTESGNPSTVAEPDLFTPPSEVKPEPEPEPPPPTLSLGGAGPLEPMLPEEEPRNEPPVVDQVVPIKQPEPTLPQPTQPNAPQGNPEPFEPQQPSDADPPMGAIGGASEPAPSAGAQESPPSIAGAPVGAAVPGIAEPALSCQPLACQAAAQAAAESLADARPRNGAGIPSGGGVCAQPELCVCGGQDAAAGVELPLQAPGCLVEDRVGQCLVEGMDLQLCQPGDEEVCSQHCNLVGNAQTERANTPVLVSVSAAQCGVGGCRYVLRGELCVVGDEAGAALSVADCSLSDAELLVP